MRVFPVLPSREASSRADREAVETAASVSESAEEREAAGTAEEAAAAPFLPRRGAFLAFFPPSPSTSMSTLPRTVTGPLPDSYAVATPPASKISPPVGKSGAGKRRISSCVEACGFLTKSVIAATTSRRLCGGIRVAIPTAIPLLPLTSSSGTRAGSTVGSSTEPSKLGAIRTVPSAERSRSSTSADRARRRHSVYRIAAGGSASRLPKLPWPSTRGERIEKGCASLTSAS